MTKAVINEAKNFDYRIGCSSSILLGELEKAMQSFNNTPTKSYALALISILLNDLDEALAHLKAFTKELPQIYVGQRRLGEVLIMRQDYTQAVEHLEKAVELSPNDHAAAIWLTLAYYRLGEVEKAQARHDLLAGSTAFFCITQDPSFLSTLNFEKS